MLTLVSNLILILFLNKNSKTYFIALSILFTKVKKAVSDFLNNYIEPEIQKLKDVAKNDDQLEAFKSYINQNIIDLENVQKIEYTHEVRLFGSEYLNNKISEQLSITQKLLENIQDSSSLDEVTQYIQSYFNEMTNTVEELRNEFEDESQGKYFASDNDFVSENVGLKTYFDDCFVTTHECNIDLGKSGVKSAIESYFSKKLKSTEDLKYYYEQTL